jgi:hypothetical protein
MRVGAALVASALAGVAAILASIDGDSDIVPFFVALTFLGGVAAWAVDNPQEAWRRYLVRSIALAWLVAAVWVGGLLAMYQAMCACSFPPRPPEATYLGLTATVYHLVGLYGGLAAIALAAFAPAKLLDPGRPSQASPASHIDG